MRAIEELLGGKPAEKSPYVLRPHLPGDMGWIVHRHGVLYAQEYGRDEQFEAFVAGIVAEFIQRYDPKKERCWIAEQYGEPVGSVLLVRGSKTVAPFGISVFCKADLMRSGGKNIDSTGWWVAARKPA